MEALYAEARTRILSHLAQGTPSDACLALRAELVEAQNFVRFIQDIHNSLSPALQLPSELWLDIGWIVFHSCEDTWLPKKGSLLMAFLPLTHICRSLRQLFHSFPSYWTNIDISSPVFKLLLQLSGALSVRVTCNAPDFQEMPPIWLDDQDQWDEENSCETISIPKSALISMVEAKERVGSMLFVADRQNMAQCLRELEGVTFRQLRQLRLQARESYDDDEFYLTTTEPIVRLQNVPLESLHLHGVRPRFYSSCYSSLRQLTLSSLSEEGYMEVSELLRLIKQCNLLEELYLLHVLKYNRPSELTNYLNRNGSSISLNSLKSLTISNNQDAVRFFLRILEYPVLQNLYLHIEPHEPSSKLLDSILSSLPLYHVIQEVKTFAIRYIHGRVTFSTLHELCTAEDPGRPGSPQEFTFKAEFFQEQDDDDDMNDIYSIESLFSFVGNGYVNQTCEALLVEIDANDEDMWFSEDDTIDAWSTIFFPMFPSLQRLKLCFKCPPAENFIFRALNPRLTHMTLCPGLEEIDISILHIDGNAIFHGLDLPERVMLEEMLASRYRAHVPLTTLRFNTFVAPEEGDFIEFIKDVKEVVRNITVIHHNVDDESSETVVHY